MINRKELVQKHNPKLRKIQLDSPLTVGNGEFAFTADVTGMQSLYSLYEEAHMPLCTMSQWGWHTTPGSKAFTLNDVEPTIFDYEDRTIALPVDKKPGSEEAYQWLRENPHRPNLARISLTLNGEEIKQEALTEINQELDLYTGTLQSRFHLKGNPMTVETSCDSETDTLAFKVAGASAAIRISFPYGSHTMSGSDWDSPAKHQTKGIYQDENTLILERYMDDALFYVSIKATDELQVRHLSAHEYELETTQFTVNFAKELGEVPDFGNIQKQRGRYWKDFWDKTGIIDFSGSTDSRASELERRLILSQYLLAIQSSGSLPPQETGLTCNSWHGKFHLEMHPWHSAWLPLYNHSDLLKRSMPWYKSILNKAEENAAKNGFLGAKWPKQVAHDGLDSPSPIATVLIWQQPHLLYLLELLYQDEKNPYLLHEYWEVVSKTAEFMCDFLTFNKETDRYELSAPIIPAQEEHDPRHVKNPTFELEYFRYGLGIAGKWADRLGKSNPWQSHYENLADSPMKDGLYLAHQNCPETFEKFNRDHPSMLGAFGYIPSDRLNKEALKNTLDKVLDVWEFETMWGWDFALMAMTATRLGLPDLAMDILLMDSPKNDYVASGNNYQRLRTDLPLYLPGNGSLLLAAALMVAGYEGSEPLPGIPKTGWSVRYENIAKYG